jgi:glucose/arabinose dehydrogenase
MFSNLSIITRVIALFVLTVVVFPTTADKLKEISNYQIEEVLSEISYPSSIAFAGGDRFFITEKEGRLRVFAKGVLSEPVSGLPTDIFNIGQGGLLDVALHPDHQDNGWIYLSYSSGTPDANRLTIARAKLSNGSLLDLQKIFTVSPDKDTPVHFGGRMAFLPDNSLLLSSGDGFDYRESAQKMDSLLGKIIRMNDDGSVPKNNPFSTQNVGSIADLIFSKGHRNPQGLVYDPVRKVIFSNEHGPAGGDEINIIHPGTNYGWPVVTLGMDYIGARISPFTEYPGMQQPLVNWTPSIAPSGMTVYYGKMFPELEGDLLSSTLVSKEVRWVQLNKQQLIGQTSLFSELKQRIRDVRVHPDGSLYLLIDSEQGKVIRIYRK